MELRSAKNKKCNGKECGELVIEDGTVLCKWFYAPYTECPIPKTISESMEPYKKKKKEDSALKRYSLRRKLNRSSKTATPFDDSGTNIAVPSIVAVKDPPKHSDVGPPSNVAVHSVPINVIAQPEANSNVITDPKTNSIDETVVIGDRNATSTFRQSVADQSTETDKSSASSATDYYFDPKDDDMFSNLKFEYVERNEGTNRNDEVIAEATMQTNSNFLTEQKADSHDEAIVGEPKASFDDDEDDEMLFSIQF